MKKKYHDLVVLGVGILILLFFVGNHCPIEHTLGIPCPGCNMFTALYWLLKGNIAVANYFHPALLPFLLYVVLCICLYIKYKKNMKNNIYFKIATILFITIFIGVYIVRMFTIFPDMPMSFNEEAIFVKLFHLF